MARKTSGGSREPGGPGGAGGYGGLKWFFRRTVQRWRYRLTGRLLCDDCRLDYRGACQRPQRPNAVVCPDHAPGGPARG